MWESWNILRMLSERPSSPTRRSERDRWSMCFWDGKHSARGFIASIRGSPCCAGGAVLLCLGADAHQVMYAPGGGLTVAGHQFAVRHSGYVYGRVVARLAGCDACRRDIAGPGLASCPTRVLPTPGGRLLLERSWTSIFQYSGFVLSPKSMFWGFWLRLLHYHSL